MPRSLVDDVTMLPQEPGLCLPVGDAACFMECADQLDLHVRPTRDLHEVPMRHACRVLVLCILCQQRHTSSSAAARAAAYAIQSAHDAAVA